MINVFNIQKHQIMNKLNHIQKEFQILNRL